MQQGQNFEHSVTTKVSAEIQTVINETKLMDGGQVIINSKHEVNVPVGKTYHVAVVGDINGRSIGRNLNVLNTLIGRDTFTFEVVNEASDPETAVFTAKIDTQYLNRLTGTAPIGALVNAVFADGSNLTAISDNLAQWTIDFDPKILATAQNIIVFCGADTFAVIPVNGGVNPTDPTDPTDPTEPTEPTEPDFNYTLVVSDDGSSASGTAFAGATVTVQIAGSNYSAVADSTGIWSMSFGQPQQHGAEMTVKITIDGQDSAFTYQILYKLSANLYENGSGAWGTAKPDTEVSAYNATQDLTYSGMSDSNGSWHISFDQLLANNDVVQISINSQLYDDFIYVGNMPDVLAKFATDSGLVGHAPVGSQVTIKYKDNSQQVVDLGEDGNWSANLNIYASFGDSVSVSFLVEGEEYLVEVFYYPISASALNETIVTGSGGVNETVVVKGISTKIQKDGLWRIKLTTPLLDGEILEAKIGDEVLSFTYTYRVNSYVSNDGTRVFGNAKDGSIVTIESSKATENNSFTVQNGSWEYVLSSPLISGEQISINIDGSSSQITYSDEDLNVITLSLNAKKDTFNVALNGVYALIRLIFGDDDMIYFAPVNLVGGDIYCGRVLSVGEQVVVQLVHPDGKMHTKLFTVTE